MITIEARSRATGGLATSAATAVLVLWRSRMFSTADIAELLTVPESEVSRLVTVSRALAGEVSA